MELSYDNEHSFPMSNLTIASRFSRMTKEIFKLLPLREEGSDWVKPLETVVVELSGLCRLMGDDEECLALTCKLTGMLEEGEAMGYPLFRRTVFECCSMSKAIERDFLGEVSENVA